MIVGITGKAGSGKDTVANELICRYGFERDTLAAPIKRFVADTFRIPWLVVDGANPLARQKREEQIATWPGWTTRKLLQFVGTELMRNNIDKDIWVKSLILRINEKPELNYVIPDIRFPNELQGLKDAFKDDFVMVKVVRNTTVTLNGISNHESEAYDLEGDVVIENNGTLLEFQEKIRLFAVNKVANYTHIVGGNNED